MVVYSLTLSFFKSSHWSPRHPLKLPPSVPLLFQHPPPFFFSSISSAFIGLTLSVLSKQSRKLFLKREKNPEMHFNVWWFFVLFFLWLVLLSCIAWKWFSDYLPYIQHFMQVLCLSILYICFFVGIDRFSEIGDAELPTLCQKRKPKIYFIWLLDLSPLC